MKMNPSSRILSVDVMRGLILLLMLFVNDLYEPGVPHWLVHTKADFDGMGLADWVFPGFLFMAGMAVPYAVQSRRKRGETSLKIGWHILLRTVSLLVIGLLIMNGSENYNAAKTGLSRMVWLLLLYAGVFLTWNHYPENSRYQKLFKALRIAGILVLAVLAIIFRSGDENTTGWMHTGWWGILGLIGWGYGVAALCYLFIGDRLLPAVLSWIFFILLNILSSSGKLHFMHGLHPVFGVVISGNVPSIVLSGMLLGILLRRKAAVDPFILALLIFSLGALYLSAGFLLHHWFIISKIQGTPSWAMVCNGISMIVFAALYLLIDVYHKKKWTYLFKEAGSNSLTTYLAPDMIYFITWLFHIPLFFYKQKSSELLAVSGSLLWAVVMIGGVIVLSRIPVRLKL